MTTLTLKVPAELDYALVATTLRLGISKSEFVRQAISQALAAEAQSADRPRAWVARWRARLAIPPDGDATRAGDPRYDAILKKHLR
jgi:predicted transcriptional regulator